MTWYCSASRGSTNCRDSWKKMSGVLCDKRIPTRVKGKIHQLVIQPAMLYGLETGPPTNKTTKRQEVAEMKMCRWACGVTRRDRVRNEDIRRQMGVKNIGLRCKSARLRWFGHITEMKYLCSIKVCPLPLGQLRLPRPLLMPGREIIYPLEVWWRAGTLHENYLGAKEL
ncbi:uncharacterized protein LOC134772260 [Penaeus indicus]|uniref:uncharacterized protein LOC134772260 n=1 Tax=Penaeus indicus TaxID=29960 RepID=UPI00300C8021